jgi:hypothetical protein
MHVLFIIVSLSLALAGGIAAGTHPANPPHVVSPMDGGNGNGSGSGSGGSINGGGPVG